MEPQEKILKTAIELFFKYGIKRITMDDVAKELGMSKKTIYQYYKDKDAIIDNMCLCEIQHHEIEFNKIASQALNPIHEVALISENITEMLKHINPLFFWIYKNSIQMPTKDFKNLNKILLIKLLYKI